MGAFEGGQGQDGAAADSGSVRRSREDGGQAATVADGAERGHSRLATQGVGMDAGHLRQCAHVVGPGFSTPFAQSPRRRLGHARVGVVEGLDQLYRRIGRGDLTGASPHDGIRIGQTGHEIRLAYVAYP